MISRRFIETLIDRLRGGRGGFFLCGSEKLMHSYSASIISKAFVKASWIETVNQAFSHD